MKKLRFYHVYNNLGEHLCGVVANTAKEGKKFVFGSEYTEDLSWIELSLKWNKEADTTGFKEGIFDDCWTAIQRGIFDSQGEGCMYCDVHEKCARFLNAN